MYTYNYRNALKIKGANNADFCCTPCFVSLGESTNISDNIGHNTLKAAINFVNVATQHAAYLAGRSELQEKVESLQIQLGASVAIMVLILFSIHAL